MIITRAPLRIPLGGGGTDFPSYYEKHGGLILGLAISKHVYVVLHDTIDKGIRLKYSKTEHEKDVDKLQNRVAAEALKYFGVTEGVEVATFSDVPECSGLGGSSSFCVALVTALREKLSLPLDKDVIFKEALEIERTKAGQVGGVQDQFFASHGGSWYLKLSSSGFEMIPFDVSKLTTVLSLVYTNSYRTNFDIADRQHSMTLSDNQEMVDNLNGVKSLGLEIKELIERGKFTDVGHIFSAHWELKKRRDPSVTNPVVDETYLRAMESGALGGKLIGIGGGGYLLLLSNSKLAGLDCIPVELDKEGTKVIFRN